MQLNSGVRTRYAQLCWTLLKLRFSSKSLPLLQMFLSLKYWRFLGTVGTIASEKGLFHYGKVLYRDCNVNA